MQTGKIPRIYISFSADINQSSTEALISVCAEHAAKADEIYLLISTMGGNVANGLNLYNVLRGLSCKLITHNVGAVNSIGNVLFLVGEERYASPNSSFMFHGVGFDIMQPIRMEQKDLRERLSSIMHDQKLIGDVISERTNIPPREVRSLFKEASTKDVSYAKERGIIHDIRDFDNPVGYPVLQLVFQGH